MDLHGRNEGVVEIPANPAKGLNFLKNSTFFLGL